MIDRAAILRNALADPTVAARRLERMRARWAEPEVKARRNAAMTQAALAPEGRAAQREGCKASWADPETKARRVAAIQAAAARPESRARKSAGVKAHAAAVKREEERRELAKAIVRAAGRPLLRDTVDFAVRLLRDGAHPHVVEISLKRAA